MATPVLSRHTLAGTLGEILVDVRTTAPGTRLPAVLLIHGFKGFKDYAFIPVMADRLARAGFTAVAMSVSGSGVDAEGEFSRLDRFAINSYSRELDDLHVVLRALGNGELGVPAPSSIGVIGHSRGGGMALLLAREAPEIRAVVTWAGIGRMRRHSDKELAIWQQLGRVDVIHQRLRIAMPLDYAVAEDYLAHADTRFNLVEAVRSLGRPWLQVHGTGDRTVEVAEADELADAADPALIRRLILDDADHTFGCRHPWAGMSEDAERVFSNTIAFLSRHLD